MNIVELLKKKNNPIRLLYFGKDDMVSGFQIKAIVENYEDVYNYYTNKEYKVSNVDDYIDYICIDTFSKLKEAIPIVREDLRMEAYANIENIKNIRKMYKTSDINKYIKSNYTIILSREYLKEHELNAYEIVEYSLDYIKSNFQSFKTCLELYEYIVENYAYKIFYELDDYRDIFTRYPRLEEILFSKKIIEGQMATKVESLKDALKMIKKGNVQLYNQSIKTISNMVKNRSFNADDEKIMYTYNDVRETKQLFEDLGENVLLDEFNKELKKQEIILNKYILKNGHHMKYEINVKEVLKALEDTKVKWEVKSLMITHTRKNKKMYSRIQDSIENETKSSILDIIASTNIDVNDYFTYSIQNHLSITIMLGKIMIKYMLSDDDRMKELLNYMFAGVVNYIDKNSIDIPNIEDDFNMLSFSLKNLLVELQKEEKDLLVCEYWSYSVLNLSIGIIEKTLREICYNFIIVNKYIPYKNLTIDNILSLPETEKFMGQANIRTIRYYLTSYNSVGKNLRNDICHHNNNLKDICNFDNVLTVIYLLLTISNELLLKVIQEK